MTRSPTDNQQTTAASTLEGLAVFLASALACLLVGLAVWRQGHVDWDATAALSHAFDVVHKEPRFNLALIGFTEPPLPAILYIPFCGLAPTLAVSGLACPILGCILLGTTAVMLNGFAARAGLPPLLRWLLVAAFVMHPLIIGLGAMGDPGIVLAFAGAGAAFALMRWSRNQGFRDLLTCSLFLTAAVLTRYEALWLVITATAYVLWRTRRAGPERARTEGTLIAFLLPLLYCACVWVGANWAIMGDPLHFCTRPATLGADHVPAAGRPLWVLSVAVVCFPALLAALYHEIRGIGRRLPLGRPAACLAIGVASGTALWPGLQALPQPAWSHHLLALSVTATAIGFALLATVFGFYLQRKHEPRPKLPMGTLLLAIIGTALAVWLSAVGRAPTLPGLPDLLQGRSALAATAITERKAARAIRDNPGPSQLAYLMGDTAFAVSLFTGAPDRVIILHHRDPGALPLNPGDLLALTAPAEERRIAAALRPKGLRVRPIVVCESPTWSLFRVERRP